MEKTKEYYRTKTIENIVGKYRFTEYKAREIVDFSMTLNNGLIIEWVIEGICNYIKDFEREVVEIDYTIPEKLELFKRSYVDGFADSENLIHITPFSINKLAYLTELYFETDDLGMAEQLWYKIAILVLEMGDIDIKQYMRPLITKHSQGELCAHREVWRLLFEKSSFV